ncbi:MAG: hypothetical protein HKP58_06210 [Desulfatitalea sp.]|nr:hypothetical protein [Desulfatitalea sp.]NNJ99990.1 hypothetical protein [Desulfatitalea sp.]
MKCKPRKARLLMGVGAFVLFASVTIPRNLWAQEMTIVVNKDVPVSELSADQIYDIFTCIKTTWDTGDQINFVILEEAGALEGFTERYLGQSATQFIRYWKKMIFTGKCNIPPSFKTREEIFEFVQSTKGAIGFVSGPAAPSVKTVKVK